MNYVGFDGQFHVEYGPVSQDFGTYLKLFHFLSWIHSATVQHYSRVSQTNQICSLGYEYNISTKGLNITLVLFYGFRKYITIIGLEKQFIIFPHLVLSELHATNRAQL